MTANIPADAVMVMQVQFNRFCIDRVTIAPFTGRDQFGDDSFGPPVDYDALLVIRQASVVNAAGELQGARGYVVLAYQPDGTAPRVGDDDRLSLPDQTTPVIIAVELDLNDPAITPTKVWF
jgi:hypothetical protein